ncbi:hypothetical protein [Geobacillus kaustophilus]|uniref:hypothetical protein n=1 Tax=Geobacillus kaustophilus TaxID=1462 RepID=UPI00059C2F71|nr:hypothetical protein [Geobacillus kaustophilus]
MAIDHTEKGFETNIEESLINSGYLQRKLEGKDPWAMVCPPPRDENPPFLPIMKNRRKQFNRTLCLMVA